MSLVLSKSNEKEANTNKIEEMGKREASSYSIIVAG